MFQNILKYLKFYAFVNFEVKLLHIIYKLLHIIYLQVKFLYIYKNLELNII